jgi:hypothetical protein
VRAAPAAAKAGRVETVYHKGRAFRIPFNVEPADRARISDVQLWFSDDSGFSWKLVSHTTPDRPSFNFRAPRDAEYWFAVRTVDTSGKLYPGEDDPVEPRMKVIVDTKPPSLVLEPDGRRGSRVAVRWEVRDENLDLSSLVLEYQAEGASAWRQVPVARRTLIGSWSWEAGTAEPLRVRGSIADKAGNTAEAEIGINEGTADHPPLTGNDQAEFATPPPVMQFSSNTASGFPPSEELPPGLADSRPFVMPPNAPASNPPGASSPGGFDAGAFGGNGSAGNPGLPPQQGPGPGPGPGQGSGSGRGPAPGGIPTLLVRGPQFDLRYAVDEAGPSGPALVELWVTRDGGRSWTRAGEDDDRTSPFPVNLGGEGTFGICLVARAATGLGDLPPAPGDLPQTWVEVDSTPPQVQLEPVQVGTGQYLGKIAIRWRASDMHLGPQPVSIAWRSDQPGAGWQPIAERIDNTGQYVWSVPPNVPARFHLRVDVVDTVGNLGAAETLEGSPVILDRARPRSRILGLEPSARTGRGAAPVAGGNGGTIIPR